MNSPDTLRDVVRKLSRALTAAKLDQEKAMHLVEFVARQHHCRISALLNAVPVFFDENPNSPKRIELEDELLGVFPPEFFDSPSQWIEALPNIDRSYEGQHLPKGSCIEELMEAPYDVSKVKIARLGEKENGHRAVRLVIKRIATDQPNEISRARAAFCSGIPTPKVLGVVEDQGNTYCIFEHVEGRNLNALADLRRNIYFSDPRFAYCDAQFEAHIEGQPFLEELSSEVKAELKALWRAYLPHILTKDIAEFCKRFADRNSMIPTKKAVLEDFIEMHNFPQADVDRVLRLHGLNSLDHLIDPGAAVECKGIDAAYMKALLQPVKEFQRLWTAIVEKAILGCDVITEKERIVALIANSSVKHKDLSPRNWVLARDGRLVLIDWEWQKNGDCHHCS